MTGAVLAQPYFVTHAKRFSRAAAACVMLIGALVLAGWISGIEALKSAGFAITMKANTSLLLLLAGFSLFIFNRDGNAGRARLAGMVCAVAIVLVGLLTLSQHLIGWDLRIDQLMFYEEPGALATASPGRMGPVASSCFTMSGIALLLLHNRRRHSVAHALAIIVCFLSLLAIVGYTYGAQELYGMARYTGIAFHTAGSFFLLGLGLIAGSADRGLISVISGPNKGALMARRLLITAFLVPFFLGWMEAYLQRTGHYDLGFGTALLVVITVAIFSAVIWHSAAKINESEQAANAANDRFRLAERAANGFVYDRDLRTGRVERSEGLVRVAGYRPGEADPTADWWGSRIHPDDARVARSASASEARGNEAWSDEYRVRHRDGHYVFVLDRGLWVRDTTGNPERIVGTIVDITERKQIEDLLRDRKAELEEIVNQTPLMFTRCTRDLRYAFVSRAYADMIGRTPQEVAGKPLLEIMGEAGLKAVIPYVERVLEGQSVEYESAIPFDSAGVQWLRVAYIPDRDAAGNVIGWFASLINISEEKQREGDQQLLFEIAEMIRLAPSADDLLFDVSKAVGEHFEARRCLFNETNLERDTEIVHRDYCRGVESVAGVHRVSEYSPVTTAEMSGGRTVVNRDSMVDPRTSDFYKTAYEPNGERAYVAVPLMRDNRWVSTLWLSDDTPRNWSERQIGLLEAVAERTWLAVEKLRVEQEREELLQREKVLRSQAELANRLKDEFLATVSHELRAPLNAMLGWTTLLRRQKLDEATVSRGLETIERNARAQAQLIEDLLDASRIVAGKLRLEIRPIDLIATIKATIDSVRPAAAAKGIQMKLVVDAAIDRIPADVNRLHQIVWNLVSNAIKFTPDGGSVEIGLERVDSIARISVTDSGEGISREFLPYVFDRFQQADGTSTRKHGGLGLGLAIVRHLVEMHGGTVEVRSEGLGRGSTFIVNLPVSAATLSELRPQSKPAIAEPSSNREPPNLAGLRILAVDDESDARGMLQSVLESYGADVLTASSAREALVAVVGWQPDLILSDIGMPGEDGYSLIEKIRRLDSSLGGATPAIALTGYARVEDRVRAVSAGFHTFVPKPVDPIELGNTIISLIGRGIPTDCKARDAGSFQ
jgi:PAS domain S-box-containing protein